MKVRPAVVALLFWTQGVGAGWSYRLPVEVQNESGASEAQVVFPVLLTTELLGSPYRGIAEDGRDLRVADEAGSQLSFWIVRFNSEGLSTLWVKASELAPGRNVIYLYWGNEEAEAVSDPEAVFAFYDGFEEELDDAVWTPVANEAEWKVVEDLDWKAEWLLEPAANEGFSAQGLTWYEGKLLISGHFENLRSVVYEIDPADGTILRSFDMPAEATHTSGIWWDGEFLWACDYNADKVFKLNLEESLETETASVVGSFESTLQGTSAVCIAEYEGERVLVLSDFAATASTYLIDFEGAIEDGTAEGHILGSYANGGASQGLLYVEDFLYECDNQVNQLLKLDLEEAVTAGNYLDAVLESYTIPSASTQGVAWDGWRGRGVRTNHPEDYPEYVKGSDIVSFDIYPVVHRSDVVRGNLWYVARGVTRLRRWTRDERVVWNCIECTRIGNVNVKPTPEQVRSEVWMSLIHGSRGLIYFVHQFKPKFIEAALLADPEMLEAVTRLNRQIHELAPVLNSPTLADAVKVTSSNRVTPVHAMVKRHGGATYLFAVAMYKEPTKATFELRGVGNARGEVLDEARTIEVRAGRFTDTFAAYQTHLYRFR